MKSRYKLYCNGVAAHIARSNVRTLLLRGISFAMLFCLTLIAARRKGER